MICKNQTSNALWLLVVIAGFAITGGCSADRETTDGRVATRELGELVLDLSDLPKDQDWALSSRSERLKTDLEAEALALGWEGGYQTSFYRKFDDSLFKSSVIEHVVSRYPKENIGQVI